MSFQGTINQAIGTVGAVAGVKRVVQGQQQGNKLAEESNTIANKELEANKLEAEQIAFNAKDELAKMDQDIMDKAYREGGPTNVGPVEEILDRNREQASAKLDEAQKEFDERDMNYHLGVSKSKPSSKQLEKAQIAFREAEDAIVARKNLMFNVEIAKKRFEALGGKE